MRFHGCFPLKLLLGLAASVFQTAVAAPILPSAGIDIVNHNLRVDLDVGDDGQIEERLVFNGVMTIERGDPFTNLQGFRQIDFVVLGWRAVTFSQTLDSEIQYIRSSVDQPVSTIISEQIGSDFPVRFSFNVIFDVFSSGTLVFPRHHGRPEGGGFMSVPPDANSPRITQFENVQIVLNHPLLGPIRFTPIDCQDTGSTTIPEPSMFLLVGTGMAAVRAYGKMRRRSAKEMKAIS
jgi:hypothetical protein